MLPLGQSREVATSWSCWHKPQSRHLFLQIPELTYWMMWRPKTVIRNEHPEIRAFQHADGIGIIQLELNSASSTERPKMQVRANPDNCGFALELYKFSLSNYSELHNFTGHPSL